MIPSDVHDSVETALGTTIKETGMVYGGDINQAAQLTLHGGDRVFIKWNRGVAPDFFVAEANGLRALAEAGAIRVPAVLAVGSDPAYLVTEWVESGGRGQMGMDFAERLGHELAALHNHFGSQHGLEDDNYIGSLRQPNARTASWVEFYRDQRIGAQMAIARQRGKLPAAREKALERLQNWLPVFLDDAAIQPSLLHGDLWGGNYMVAANGDPVLIDPAVYYGHREIDLAMTELFGGFSPGFYSAYNEVYALDGYEQRRLLYQLYPLLVHMNLFGGGYAARVDAIVRHYVG
ncbi:MAG: fructosamine kinase family protein [Anaerolineae bacterium]|nr:fructosamine kinase family protein [Anaerolineae bacterium]